jgi:hypothetical protein
MRSPIERERFGKRNDTALGRGIVGAVRGSGECTPRGHGDGGEFKTGMVFAFNIDLFDPKWRNGETGAVFADTVVITDTGARYLHAFSQDLQRVG